jgi:hypothetical protein
VGRPSISRSVFPARGRVVKLNLGGDPATAFDRVIGALDAGDITASEAKDFIDVLRARAEMIQTADALPLISF